MYSLHATRRLYSFLVTRSHIPYTIPVVVCILCTFPLWCVFVSLYPLPCVFLARHPSSCVFICTLPVVVCICSSCEKGFTLKGKKLLHGEQIRSFKSRPLFISEEYIMTVASPEFIFSLTLTATGDNNRLLQTA